MAEQQELVEQPASCAAFASSLPMPYLLSNYAAQPRKCLACRGAFQHRSLHSKSSASFADHLADKLTGVPKAKISLQFTPSPEITLKVGGSNCEVSEHHPSHAMPKPYRKQAGEEGPQNASQATKDRKKPTAAFRLETYHFKQAVAVPEHMSEEKISSQHQTNHKDASRLTVTFCYPLWIAKL